MSNIGFDEAGLSRLHDLMAGYVENGTVPGIVTLLSRNGETHVDAIGTNERDGEGRPMERDTIFRISSVSKPITAAAAMALVDDGVVRLDDPVDDLLPELADRQVLRRLDGPVDDTVRAERPITLRDLLTFRSGYGAVMADPSTTPVLQAIIDLDIGLGPPSPQAVPPPDEWIARIGTLPLIHQPGEQWLYHTAADILGVLIARATGQTFGSYLDDRILVPLGMVDTGFFVPPESLPRLPTQYATEPETGEVFRYDEPGGQWSSPPAFPGGGAGLVSTVDDLLAFGEMLLGRGRRGDVRVLSESAVELMTTDHLTTEQKAASGLSEDELASFGWGFGMSVVTRSEGVGPSVGSFGWDGGLGTSWMADPVEGLTLALMTQVAWPNPEPPAVFRDFWRSAYEALRH